MFISNFTDASNGPQVETYSRTDRHNPPYMCSVYAHHKKDITMRVDSRELTSLPYLLGGLLPAK
jgi:hypothetical protein